MIAIKLTDVINEIERFKGYLDEDMMLRIKIALNRLPTIDAEPIRHGKWNILEGMPTQCSLCGYYVKQKTFKYCPYCGARMDDEISNIAKESADKISKALDKVRAKGMQNQNIKEDDEP